MCTLVVRFAPGTDAPLCVAANRDERLSRPSSPPRPWEGPVPFFAPRDEEKGGSWLGVTGRGMFVGVTNRFGVSPEPARASRGRLVLEALSFPSAALLHAQLAGLAPSAYNAFHLLYADLHHAFVTWSDGKQLTQQALDPGVHIVTERSLGGDDRARAERLRRTWDTAIGNQVPSAQSLQELLRLHDDDSPIGGSCIHVPALGYGTRSGLVLRLVTASLLAGHPPRRPGEHPDVLKNAELFWAEGPPCTTAFEDLSPALHRLVAAT